MKCDGCGRQFPAEEAEVASRNEAVRPGGRFPYTKLVSMTLCPVCAGSRKGMFWFLLWAIVGLILAIAVVSALAT